MTPDRWQRVQQLFYEADSLPPAEQREFLEKACGGEASLFREVRTLLGYQDSDDIEAAVQRVAMEAHESLATKTLPERISEYRVIRQLGEGGMGVVYEGEQLNPRRRVALKVIRLSAHAGQRARRLFQREAEALGRLKHPGIATIYESGVTADGVPFIAMELVEGTPVNDWINSLPVPRSLRKEDVAAQLRVFRSICDAILYAHQNGVIHRDLKPSNVLVIAQQDSAATGSRGDLVPVKVLDFGLARILEPETGGGDATEAGVVQGSVPFMSPEQASGETSRIDIRTDIYALGVMLFWMLTRHHPYLDGQTSLVDSLRMILEAPPRRFREWFTRWDADLEVIVFKALEKDRDQRYQSVSTFAADIDRYLDDLPITARPPSTVYQLRKLIHRNRTGFAALIALLLMIAGFSISTVVQSHRVRAERDRANQEAATARQVSDFLLDLFRNANPSEAGGQLTARDLLHTGKQRVSKLLGDQPELRARLLDRIGDAYQVVGPLTESHSALDESIKIREAAFGKDNLDSATSWASLSMTYFNEGNYRAAAGSARRALAIRRKHLASDDALMAEPLDSLANALSAQGEWKEAESLSRQAVEVDRHHPEVSVLSKAARLSTLGNILRNQGNFKDAIPVLREAVAGSRNLPEGQGQTAFTLNELGIALMLSGDAAGAERVYRDDLDLTSRTFGPDHANVSVLMRNIANCLNAQGKYREAETMAREALAAFIKALGPNHPRRADMLESIGDALEGQGRNAEAGAAFNEWASITNKAFGAENPRALRASIRLAEWQGRFGNPHDAVKRVELNRAVLVKTGKAATAEWGLNQRADGYAKAALHDWASAEALLTSSHELLVEKLGATNWQTNKGAEVLAQVRASRSKLR